MNLFEWPDAEHIYLSPHLDDVVLSCGGTIYQQLQAGERVAVISVFAGSPTEMVESEVVRELHQRWVATAEGMHAADPPSVRREEDRASFEALNPGIEVMHLMLLDCIYRTHPEHGEPMYRTHAALFGDVDPDDPARAALASMPALPEGITLYCPLGVGNHVDHQVVREAVERLDHSTGQVRYYTDYPYAGIKGAVEAVIGDGNGWKQELVAISDEALEAKVRAVAEHRSQISSFWESMEAMAEAVRGYVKQVGGEVTWRRKQATFDGRDSGRYN